MTNHEERREFKPSVHMIMAFNRAKDSDCPNVIRKVVHKSLEDTLKIFRAQLVALGGEWRIHHTVNARDTEKARKTLLKKLIDYPEKSCSIDTEWRTALLQRDCIYGVKKFMFDVDTKEYHETVKFEELLGKKGTAFLKRFESPKGYHYITRPFDTREICELEYVTLLRDGYYYLETVGGA